MGELYDQAANCCHPQQRLNNESLGQALTTRRLVPKQRYLFFVAGKQRPSFVATIFLWNRKAVLFKDVVLAREQAAENKSSA